MLASRLREAHNVCNEHRDIAMGASSRSGSMKPNAEPGSFRGESQRRYLGALSSAFARVLALND